MENDAWSDIVGLISPEREGRDRHWWGRMRDCYHDDARIHTAWFSGSGVEFVEASKDMAARNDITRHRMYIPMVHINGDRAVATMPMNVDERVSVHGVEADLITYARAV